jgi:signal transduction histidine kinase
MLNFGPNEHSFGHLNFTEAQTSEAAGHYQAEIAKLSRKVARLEHVTDITRLVRHELAGPLNLDYVDYLLPSTHEYLRLAHTLDNQPSKFNAEVELKTKGSLFDYLTQHPRVHLLPELEEACPENLSELERLRFFGVQLVLPLCKSNLLVGIIIARVQAPLEFQRSVQRLYLEMLGTQLAMTLQNIYASQKLSSHTAQIASVDRYHLELLNRKLMSAREEERKHFSRELHDEVIQDLLLLQDQLEQFTIQTTTSETPSPFSAAYERTANLVKVVREICSDLRPRLLDLSLSFSLNEMVRRFQRTNSQPNLTLKIEGTEPVSSEQARLVTYRVAQEALHNCLKHAHAEQAYLFLKFVPASPEAKAMIELSIIDNGQGFEPPSNIHDLFKQGHLGLVGMYERVIGVGGHLWISSVQGSGTKIMVRVPTTNPDETD